MRERKTVAEEEGRKGSEGRGNERREEWVMGKRESREVGEEETGRTRGSKAEEEGEEEGV